MSNAGLSNLASLKAFVLPESLVAETTWDTRLTQIGKGVAAALEKACNRKFLRTVGDTFEFSAECAYVIVPRFPIESVSAISQRDDYGTGFVEGSTSVILHMEEKAGLIDFGGPLGSHTGLVRITYTGGYFFETLEPTDDGYPTATPSGSTALPEDLRQAWMLGVQKVFERTRSLSTSGVKSDEKPDLPPITLGDDVMEMVKPFVRFAR